MINYSLSEFKNTIQRANSDFLPAYLKDFINQEHLPSWFDFLDCIYQEWQEPTDLELAEIIAKNGERLNGSVIVGKDLYINALNGINSPQEVRKKFKKYFPEMFDVCETIRQHIGIDIVLSGPKVCVGPYQNMSHKDNWPAFSLQCQGSTIWTLTDKTLRPSNASEVGQNIEYQEKFELNPGDLLFFPQGMYHEIETFAPRASLQFNSTL
jgi:hypothetical protein